MIHCQPLHCNFALCIISVYWKGASRVYLVFVLARGISGYGSMFDTLIIVDSLILRIYFIPFGKVETFYASNLPVGTHIICRKSLLKPPKFNKCSYAHLEVAARSAVRNLQ